MSTTPHEASTAVDISPLVGNDASQDAKNKAAQELLKSCEATGVSQGTLTRGYRDATERYAHLYEIPLLTALQDYSKLETKIVTALSDGQQQLAQALIKKHGDDFKAMERDIKLNTHQKSKGQLKSLCTKYLAGIEEEEGSESESKEDKADE
ncbi:hypothetical protein SARC_00776 [Sphaeroforma arctica JP610]|uniref:Nucleolar protein 16 n=1 Tax=Sphaeroforma arctica JP610 TaxID=667725 RepID=A0A0L0GE03_9EUKA|nr:hypothetical protein SARC_00776 [Sphaeroforma arctica JP610]KNC87101.1 hypothetical protein SARC_00776 [Sphaeroforma arctica JP610]|eukprot:XP_014161003.1 hypothetical protein SARC_00776 [Sphaeroforma arctica JP610]